MEPACHPRTAPNSKSLPPEPTGPATKALKPREAKRNLLKTPLGRGNSSKGILAESVLFDVENKVEFDAIMTDLISPPRWKSNPPLRSQRKKIAERSPETVENADPVPAKPSPNPAKPPNSGCVQSNRLPSLAHCALYAPPSPMRTFLDALTAIS
jgi:hypothetical protein